MAVDSLNYQAIYQLDCLVDSVRRKTQTFAYAIHACHFTTCRHYHLLQVLTDPITYCSFSYASSFLYIYKGKRIYLYIFISYIYIYIFIHVCSHFVVLLTGLDLLRNAEAIEVRGLV